MTRWQSALIVGVIGLAFAASACGGGDETAASKHPRSTAVVATFAPERASAVSDFVSKAAGAELMLPGNSWIAMDYARHQAVVQWCDSVSADRNASSVARKLATMGLFQRVAVRNRTPLGMGNC